jgi:hypothetical protein
LGFLISSVTVLALQWASCLAGFEMVSCRSYEAPVLPNADAVRRRLKVDVLERRIENADALFLSATLDHELISRPIHSWLLRRWNVFYIT